MRRPSPLVTTLGPDFPKTGIFIGNSFFYYNNSLPGTLSLMERPPTPPISRPTAPPW